MKKLALVVAAAALMSAGMSSPHVAQVDSPTRVRQPVEPILQRVQLLCQDQSASGNCPTPRQQCREECWDTYMEDTFRCQTGAEGILDWQRNICHGKATIRYGACNVGCDHDHPY